jgi:hypothetical protein
MRSAVAAGCLTLAGAMPLPFSSHAADAPATGAGLPSAATGLQRDVVFTEYFALSSSLELAARLLTPLVNAATLRKAANSGMALQPQPIDLALEKYVLYVPSAAPPRGYSLLVFVPPWKSAVVPPGWAAVLDRHGMIFVSAANSGNDVNVISRRIPLALLAAHNVLSRYPVDRQHVYIGGFSGGSRVAQRMALAYPDVFHGALLNSGSDPIGEAQIAPPSAGLFGQFQSSTRLVYSTGSDDHWNVERDEETRHSMREWCVFGFSVDTTPGVGHEPPAPQVLDRALSALARPVRPDPAKIAECGARIADKLAAELGQVRALIDLGKHREADALLNKIDARYGGLASAESIELAERIDAAGATAPGSAP